MAIVLLLRCWKDKWAEFNKINIICTYFYKYLHIKGGIFDKKISRLLITPVNLNSICLKVEYVAH